MAVERLWFEVLLLKPNVIYRAKKIFACTVAAVNKYEAGQYRGWSISEDVYLVIALDIIAVNKAANKEMDEFSDVL